MPLARWCASYAAELSGLLHGQGGFVTMHHAPVLSPHAASEPQSQETSVQSIVDAARNKASAFDAAPSGNSKFEAFTILYGANAGPNMAS